MAATQTYRPPPTALIYCAVMEDEVRHFSRGLDHIVAIHELPQGLHNTPELLRQRLQAAVDQVESETRAEVIVLVYGLCSRGSEGVTTRRARLVISRAHDCITLLLGSKERYADYVRQHPGTYWYSPGWNRHHVAPGAKRHQLLYEEYRKKFSEEDAQYLMETEQAWFSTYDRATFVDLGATDPAADVAYTQECANWLKWKFDRQAGDPQFFKDLLSGPWDAARFVVLEPGESFKMTADERVMERVALTVRGQLPETAR
jgi:hypothetical protein